MHERLIYDLYPLNLYYDHLSQNNYITLHDLGTYVYNL